jgi:glucose/mannose-6-phosphate isomerase
MKREDVLAYPEQIGDALWRVEAAGVPSGDVEVCGVAYGAGELASAIVGDRGGSGGERVLLCASYSGDDEEALECFEVEGRRVAVCTSGELATRARAEGVPVIGVPGGFEDPRAAIVYFTVAAVVCAAPQLRTELEAAVPSLSRLAEGEQVELDTPSERVLGERLLKDLAAANP